MSHRIEIRRLRAPVPAGVRAGRVRQAAEAALADADPHLPPQAILVLREARLRLGSGRAIDLREAAGQARGPADPQAATAGAVLFPDRGSLLAEAIRLAGSPWPWYLQAALGRRPARTALGPAVLAWLAADSRSPEFGPLVTRVLSSLAEHGRLPDLLGCLAPADARHLAAAVCGRSPGPAAPSPLPPDPEPARRGAAREAPAAVPAPRPGPAGIRLIRAAENCLGAGSVPADAAAPVAQLIAAAAITADGRAHPSPAAVRRLAQDIISRPADPAAAPPDLPAKAAGPPRGTARPQRPSTQAPGTAGAERPAGPSPAAREPAPETAAPAQPASSPARPRPLPPRRDRTDNPAAETLRPPEPAPGPAAPSDRPSRPEPARAQVSERIGTLQPDAEAPELAKETADADDPVPAGIHPDREGWRRTPTGGLVWVIRALARLGIAEAMDAHPLLDEAELGRRVLVSMLLRAGGSPADPLAEAFASDPPEGPAMADFLAPAPLRRLWAAEPLRIRRLAGAPGWRLASDRRDLATLAMWRGRMPDGIRAWPAGLARGTPVRGRLDDRAVLTWELSARRYLRAATGLCPRTLIRRPGLALVSSGYLDLALSARDIELPVRMAGLDIDPGWVLWLYRAVQIHYDFDGA
ncbi:hypothetical protein [Mangrovicoccus sp. HB161399]|uniref:hypothetical protein n=1 Tax=Mangrovicoccus sp. HB161399 TaxID=2720392 RepID=UPI00155772C6|nr:hypothetical protein [Mangrovicoccus sp. HB161399]